MAMTPNICYQVSAFEWTSKDEHHQDWLWDHLFWISNAHFTAWIWVMNIIEDANAFPFMIWFDKLRGIHGEEHWAYNDEPFTARYEMYVWTTRWFPWRLVITYTWRVLFQLEESLWLVDNLDGCWHEAHNQSEGNSQKNPKEKILHDESSNTTLGGRVKLDKQREQ